MNDAEPCACTTLTLDDALLAQLRERYDRCLCIACLAELKGGAAAAPVSLTGSADPR